MSTITTIQSTDLITNSRADINTNFANLNSDKIETSTLDTDTTLAANSDSKIPTQKAVKAYVDAGGNVNASETSKGIVEEATDAEIVASTDTGGTGARLFVPPSKLNTQINAVLTGTTFNHGVSAKNLADANGATTVIAHGLSTTPKRVKFTAIYGTSSASNVGNHAFSFGIYDGTNTNSIENHFDSGNSAISAASTTIAVHLYGTTTAFQTAVATIDSTNITLTWSKTNSPTGTAHILWEAWKY